MSKFHAIVLAGAALLIAPAASAQSDSAAPRHAVVRDIQVAQLFGESDEEKAARLQREQNQDSQISNLNNQINDLEATITRLTGQMEQFDHRMAELKTRMERMQKDYDYKLCSIAAQQMGASTDPNDPNAMACAGGQQQSAPQQGAPPPSAPQARAPQSNAPLIAPRAYAPGQTENYEPAVTVNVPPPSTPMPEAHGAPVHLAPPPGVLGTLPADRVGPPPAHQRSGIETGMLPSVDAPSQFDSGKKLLAQAQFDEARAQFRGFVDAHPDDPRAPQALFWIGNISYAQHDYPNASRSFAEGLKKYPTSTVAPDTMLKLGQSLLAMNKKREGCTFLGAIASKYPDASKAAAQALAAGKASHCR
ncbi:MAG TPA: tol-pal system protein YbgF [Rhizomicrobium sp.]|jgi:tol-pal system protein YbgF